MARWYEIRNAAKEGEVPVVTIFGDIGAFDISAADFARDFRAVSAPEITLEINSYGGSVFEGLAIYNILRGSGKKITAKVMGVAASIASVILMAADKIVMPENAMVMVHAPAGGVFGTAKDMRDMAELLDKVQQNLVATYMKRTGKTADEVNAMLAQDTWMSAAEAKEAGFADEIIDKVEVTASADVSKLPEAARAVFAKATKPAAAPAPAAAATPAPAPAAGADDKPEPAFADQVSALAKDAGFEAHAGLWATSLKTVDEVKARIETARQIKALCALVKKDDLVDGFIKGGKSLVDVQTELNNAQVDDRVVDTSRKNNERTAPELSSSGAFAKRREQIEAKNSNQPTEKDAGQSAVSTADVWAKRRNLQHGV